MNIIFLHPVSIDFNDSRTRARDQLVVDIERAREIRQPAIREFVKSRLDKSAVTLIAQETQCTRTVLLLKRIAGCNQPSN